MSRCNASVASFASVSSVLDDISMILHECHLEGDPHQMLHGLFGNIGKLHITTHTYVNEDNRAVRTLDALEGGTSKDDFDGGTETAYHVA